MQLPIGEAAQHFNVAPHTLGNWKELVCDRDAAAKRTASTRRSGKQTGAFSHCPPTTGAGSRASHEAVASPKQRKKALTGACPSKRAPILVWNSSEKPAARSRTAVAHGTAKNAHATPRVRSRSHATRKRVAPWEALQVM